MRSTANPRSALMLLGALLLMLALSDTGHAQATTAFTYQGRLDDGGTAATGTYQMQFTLYGSLTGTDVIGSPVVNNSVTVSNGIFTVLLDFGANAFTASAARFLEIATKRPADPGFTILLPRNQLTTTPFAIQSVNAVRSDALSVNCVSCVTSAQIASLDGSKVSGTVATATNAANFTGSLSGDVGGTQGSTAIQPNAVTGSKIAANQVVKSFNGLRDSVILSGGSGITLTTVGNTVTVTTANPLIRKFEVTSPLGSPMNVLITHNLGTSAVQVVLYRLNTADKSFEQIPLGSTGLSSVRVLNDNQITMAILATGTIKIVVIG